MNKKKREHDFLTECSKELMIGSILLCVVVFLMIMFSGCTAYERMNDYLGIPDDNVVEELIEGVIEKQTGVDIDLTPRSPEKIPDK